MDTTGTANHLNMPIENVPDKPVALGPRRVSKVLPPGYSYLTVPIRTETLANLHLLARISTPPLSFPEFMERWCQEAFPYNGPTSTQGKAPESSPDKGLATRP